MIRRDEGFARLLEDRNVSILDVLESVNFLEDSLEYPIKKNKKNKYDKERNLFFCTSCKTWKEYTVENFCYRKNGKLSTTCKVCNMMKKKGNKIKYIF